MVEKKFESNNEREQLGNRGTVLQEKQTLPNKQIYWESRRHREKQIYSVRLAT